LQAFGNPMGLTYLRLLGRFTVAHDEAFLKAVRLSTRKAGALLAVLAMSPQQTCTREELGALLWGSSSDAQARQSLRQAIHLLRKDLHADIVDAGGDAIRLQPGRVWVDALHFEALSASGAFADLERAAALVQGEFLAGFDLAEEAFEDWLRHQRRHFETAGTGAFEGLALECDRLGKGVQAVATAERLLAIDPLREDWQRLALRLYARHRGPAEALAQAKTFSNLLQRELGVEPEPQTRALIEEIKKGAFAPPPAAPRPQAAKPGVAAPAPAATPASIDAGTAPAAPLPQAVGWLAGQWAALWQQPRRGLAAVALTAASVLLVGLAAQIIGRSATPPAVAVSAKPAPPLPAPDPWRSPRQQAAAKSLIPILVLPFKTYGEAAGSTQILADMMWDDLINVLSRVPGLRVISRATSRSYSEQPIDVAAIGAELHVRYILECSLRLHGERLRVNVELIDPAIAVPVWSGRIERDGGDRHGVQDEIVGRLARELRFEAIAAEGERPAKDGDTDTLVHRGRAAMWAAYARSSAAAFEQAAAYYKQALERDPDNIPAQVGLAAFHTAMGVQHLDNDGDSHLNRAFAILQDVLRRQPSHSGAHHFMGFIHRSRGDFMGALEAFERAVEFNPSSAGSHAHFGHTLAQMGRAAEGLEHVRYAMRLSPRDPNRAFWLSFECNAMMELGRYREAIESCRRAIALNPAFLSGWAGLAAAHALAGDMGEARVHLNKLKTLAPHLSEDELVKRFGRHKAHPARIREGLKLVLRSAG
jgi:DNA-binding SARP family transcriptional activator/TolB-like protein